MKILKVLTVILWPSFFVTANLSPVEILKYNESSRYFMFPDDNGQLHLIDKNKKISSLAMRSYFNLNYYFYNRKRRESPYVVSKDEDDELKKSGYNNTKPVKVIVHGWKASSESILNTILVSSFLDAMDANVIVVDWSEGASGLYITSVNNVLRAGKILASFLNWLIESGTPLSKFHLLGHSLGAHLVGIAARNIIYGKIPYITAFDPAGPLWGEGSERLKSDDAEYVEVIHTNAGYAGIAEVLGKTDFFPNGGSVMPECHIISCSHGKSYEYYSKTISNSSFVGIKCKNVDNALEGQCVGPEHLMMGGARPKRGKGIFYLLFSEENITTEVSENVTENGILMDNHDANLLS